MAVVFSLAFLSSVFFGLADIEGMIREGLRDWGHTAPLLVNVGIDADTTDPPGVVAWGVTYFTGDTGAWVRDACGIDLKPLFFSARMTPAMQQHSITHELGHCFGLVHHDGPGIMGPDWAYEPITDAERALYRQNWPLPHRVVAPMVGMK